jgi:thiosulfate dehydrogenase
MTALSSKPASAAYGFHCELDGLGFDQACTSCHQAGGSKPFAIPWVGVKATFPQYRGREDQISTVEERINGCMERSMNGKAR